VGELGLIISAGYKECVGADRTGDTWTMLAS